MTVNLNRAQEIFQELEKRMQIIPMNTAQDADKINNINEYMENVKRDYRIKETESQNFAASIILMD